MCIDGVTAPVERRTSNEIVMLAGKCAASKKKTLSHGANKKAYSLGVFSDSNNRVN